jgi:hypothetical protein
MHSHLTMREKRCLNCLLKNVWGLATAQRAAWHLLLLLLLLLKAPLPLMLVLLEPPLPLLLVLLEPPLPLLLLLQLQEEALWLLYSERSCCWQCHALSQVQAGWVGTISPHVPSPVACWGPEAAPACSCWHCLLQPDHWRHHQQQQQHPLTVWRLCSCQQHHLWNLLGFSPTIPQRSLYRPPRCLC